MSLRSFYYYYYYYYRKKKTLFATLPQLPSHYLCSETDLNNPACVSISIGSQNWILFFDFTFFFYFFIFSYFPPHKRRTSPPKRRNPKRKRHSRKSALLNLPQSSNPCFVMVLLDLYCPKGIAPFMRCRNFFSLAIRQGSGAWPSHH